MVATAFWCKIVYGLFNVIVFVFNVFSWQVGVSAQSVVDSLF